MIGLFCVTPFLLQRAEILYQQKNPFSLIHVLNDFLLPVFVKCIYLKAHWQERDLVNWSFFLVETF